VTVDAAGQSERVDEAELPPPPTPVDNLVDCAQGRGEPELDGETAVHIVEILDAAYRAARSGHKVTL
jgi:predicted dehydrogenase